MLDLDKARQQSGDTNQAVFEIVMIVNQCERQTKAEVVEMGKGVCCVDCDGNDHGIDLVKKDSFDLAFLFFIECFIGLDRDSVGVKLREDIPIALFQHFLLLTKISSDRCELFARGKLVRACLLYSGFIERLQPRHSDHIKFIEVRTVDCQKF